MLIRWLTCALITALRLSCSAFSTTNLARSASWAATCLASMAWVNTFPKLRLVMDTSSRAMLKFLALSVRIFLISLLTACIWLMNCYLIPTLRNPEKINYCLENTKWYLSLCDELTGIVLGNHSFECFMNDRRQNYVIEVLTQVPVDSRQLVWHGSCKNTKSDPYLPNYHWY